MNIKKIDLKIIHRPERAKGGEQKAIDILKGYFEKDFDNHPQASGTVYITNSIFTYGETVQDMDIVIFGKLHDYYVPVTFSNPKYHPIGTYKVSIETFCFVIELKSHNNDGVTMENGVFWVDYNGYPKPVNMQSQDQIFSLAHYIEKNSGLSPFVNNFIWFKGLSRDQLNTKTGGNHYNAVSCVFSFDELIQIIGDNKCIKFYNNSFHLGDNKQSNYVDCLKKALLKNSPKAEGLTRTKIELLSQMNFDAEASHYNVGKNLIKFSGLAGTGKTVDLLHLALSISNEKTGNRCLLLTYNSALVGDTRRLLAFWGVSEKVDSYSVQIQTLHKFFIGLMDMMGIKPKGLIDIDTEYEPYLDQLYDYIVELCDDKDIQYLKDENRSKIDWDYIFIDEAQDWKEREKDILFKIYGPDRIVVADGVNQFLRNGDRVSWEKGLKNSQIFNKKIGLRQKSNLTTFVQEFAEEFGVKRKLKENPESPGGRIYIVNKYSPGLHSKLLNKCKEGGCEPYDLLFFTPPSGVGHDASGDYFKLIDPFREAGMYFYDGTNKQNRNNYPTDVSLSRLYQYESCRGLEGWCVVCFRFDELIANKYDTIKVEDGESMAIESKESKIKKKVYEWALMPLTRPIDTLVIMLKNPQSEVGQVLLKLARRFDDFVTVEII